MNSFDGGKANYYCANGIEAQDVIEAFELNFSRGSALKYLLRAGRKTDDEVRDLEKARAYIDREIQRLRASDLEGLAKREAQWTTLEEMAQNGPNLTAEGR